MMKCISCSSANVILDQTINVSGEDTFKCEDCYTVFGVDNPYAGSTDSEKRDLKVGRAMYKAQQQAIDSPDNYLGGMMMMSTSGFNPATADTSSLTDPPVSKELFDITPSSPPTSSLLGKNLEEVKAKAFVRLVVGVIGLIVTTLIFLFFVVRGGL